ncbi:hypothetical protein M569_13461, partial [Genlisea aurea]
AARGISQRAFDEMVQENIDELGMDPAEALEDVLQTLTLQGVDLSGIVTCLPGEVIPVIDCLRKLEEEEAHSEVVELLAQLNGFFTDKGSGNASVAAKNGAVELLISLCRKLRRRQSDGDGDRGFISALNAMAAVIHDLRTSETFREQGGPNLVVDVLQNDEENVDTIDACFSVVAAASTGNELLKESFMDLKIDNLILRTLTKLDGRTLPAVYDAIRIILSPDDNRVVASQVFGYARQFSKSGIPEALVDALRGGLTSPHSISATTALKAVAVNDEICKSVASAGGIDAVLRSIEESSRQGNNDLARASCSLLSKLAGSDENKRAVVGSRGMEKLVSLSARFSRDPSVVQEVMSVICCLCLRSPENAARAMESGAGDLAVRAMHDFPKSDQLQRSSCFMIRNLVARNPENRKILVSNGIEALIRRAKENHGRTCKDAATDALRDLGVDNYNS